MFKSGYRLLSQFTISFVALLALLGCSNNPDSFPQIASPPPFDYIDGQELRSNMHQLAFELQKLDLALMTETDDSPNFQREIVDSLENIERIGGFLLEGDFSTRHPFLQDGMTRFLADASRARADAARTPPRFYMAGRISGGCITCHRDNR